MVLVLGDEVALAARHLLVARDVAARVHPALFL